MLVTPSIVNYHFSPSARSFSLLANKTDATFTALLDPVFSGNAIDTPEFFVRQQYLDFLGREPDESGLNFWSEQILSCGGDTALCPAANQSLSRLPSSSRANLSKPVVWLTDSIARVTAGDRSLSNSCPTVAAVAQVSNGCHRAGGVCK